MKRKYPTPRFVKNEEKQRERHIAMTRGGAKAMLEAAEALEALKHGETKVELPTDCVIDPTRDEIKATCQEIGVEPPADPLPKGGWVSQIFVTIPKSRRDWKDVPDGDNSEKSSSHEDDRSRAPSYWQQVEKLASLATKRKIPSDKVIADLREKLSDAPIELPPLDPADQFCDEPDDTPPEVIAGILHQGSKGELGGGSKTFKTWTLLQMANCVSSGIPWLEFETHAGEVLYINFELPRFSIRRRVKDICNALGIKPSRNLKLLNLRGYAADAHVILPRIIEEIRQHKFVLIIIDPLYKILGDREENASKDMADLMLAIERLAVDSNAAVFFGAHFSKGNQSLKEAIDRVSGSGVLSRDPDTIITMTQHEEKEAYVVDMILRNFPPQEQFCIQREHPLMLRANGLDPTRLKKPNQSVFSSSDLLEVLELGGGSLAYNDWREKCKAQIGLGASTFYKYFKELRDAGRVFYSSIDEKWSLKSSKEKL